MFQRGERQWLIHLLLITNPCTHTFTCLTPLETYSSFYLPLGHFICYTLTFGGDTATATSFSGADAAAADDDGGCGGSGGRFVIVVVVMVVVVVMMPMVVVVR